jgi:hypothetical protein
MRMRCRYQSTVMGSYQTIELIETFVSYAESIKRCICIVYDPQRSGTGTLALKAIKLKEAFIKVRSPPRPLRAGPCPGRLLCMLLAALCHVGYGSAVLPWGCQQEFCRQATTCSMMLSGEFLPRVTAGRTGC